MLKGNNRWAGYDNPNERIDKICLLAEIPNTHEDRIAIISQFYDLTKWIIWRQDGTQKATQSAQAWKDVKLKFIDCEDVAYVDGEEVINLEINNNISVNCGCGCSGSGGVGGYFDPNNVPEGFENGNNQGSPDWSEEYPTEADYDAAKCSLVNAFVNDLIQSLRGLIGSGLLLAGGAASAMFIITSTNGGALALTGLVALGFSFGAAFAIAAAAIIAMGALGGGLVGYFTDVIDYTLANRQQLVCDLYATDTPEQFRTVIRSHYNDAVLSLALNETSSTILLNGILLLVDSFTPDELVTGIIRASAQLLNANRTAAELPCDVCGQSLQFFKPLNVEDDFTTEQWVNGQIRINKSGLDSAGADRCAVDGYCRQGVHVTSTSNGFDGWFQQVFIAESSSGILTFGYAQIEAFAQTFTLVVDGNGVGTTPTLINETYPDVVPFYTVSNKVIEFTNAIEGAEYRIRFAGNKFIVAQCDIQWT